LRGGIHGIENFGGIEYLYRRKSKELADKALENLSSIARFAKVFYCQSFSLCGD